MQSIEQIIAAHHDAFLVDIFGPWNCGLSAHRLQELRDLGLIFFQDFPVPGQDPVSTAIALGRMSEKYTSQERNDAMQHLLRAPLAELVPVLVEETKAQKKPTQEQAPGHQVIDHSVQVLSLDKPPPPDDVKAFEPPKKPPRGIDGRYKDAYIDGVDRIGSYCRGLGDVWQEKVREWVGEEWNGEDIEVLPDAPKREHQLAIIRRLVLAAWQGHRDPQRLAEQLARETKDFNRDWHRIAVTELQALYNEAVLLQAVERHGDQTRLARVPEQSACKDCKRLFLDEYGEPVVKSAKEWLEAGTNVGKPRRAWVATIYPLHSRCVCTVQVVPPGCRIDRKGMVVRGALRPPTSAV